MWLITAEVRERLDAALKNGFELDPQARSEFDMRAMARRHAAVPEIYGKQGDTAVIRVDGVLTESPDFFAELFGGGNTTYGEIIRALSEAEQDREVKRIEIEINSPGGTVAGFFGAADALAAAKKPTEAVVSSLAASAAYGLASKADKITATNRGASFGSIGVVVSTRTNADDVIVTSSNAPNKRPDLRTDTGRAQLRQELDEIETLFIDAIASGRGVTAETVKTDFGRGGMFTAEKAQERGLIDGIAGTSQTETAGNSGTQSERKSMDSATLKADHPNLYAQIRAEGEQAGVNKERDRVGAFLTYGQKSGALDIAHKAITDGAEMSQTLMAQFMTAGANQSALDAQAQDGDEADTGDAGGANEAEAAEAREKKLIQQIEQTAFAELGLDYEALV